MLESREEQQCEIMQEQGSMWISLVASYELRGLEMQFPVY